MILEIIEWNPMTMPYFDGLVKSADSAQLAEEFKLADITPKGAVFVSLLKFMVQELFGHVEQDQQLREIP